MKTTRLALLLASCVALPAAANTYGVGTLSGGNVPFSLHQAILSANANPGHDIIDLTGVAGRITLTADLPQITDGLTIRGDGRQVIDGDGLHRPFDFFDDFNIDFDVTVEGLIFENGWAEGGIERDNYGGAILTQGVDEVVIRDCVFRENASEFVGGALCIYANSFIVERCAFLGNATMPDPGSLPEGGALFTGSDAGAVRNCTFHGNRATDRGGVGYHFTSGSILYEHCTIIGNEAGGTGTIYINSGACEIRNTVFRDNVSNGVGGSTYSYTTAAASVVESGVNWKSGDPMLGPLGLYQHDYIPTFNLCPGSPLLDAATGTTVTTDARGVARLQNDAADIGAFEARQTTIFAGGFGSDSGPGTLRAALLDGFDYIRLAPIFDPIQLTSALPLLDGVVIEGLGPDVAVIQPPSDEYIFEINGGEPVILSKIRFGAHVDLDPIDTKTGIYLRDSELWVKDCYFREHVSYSRGSAIKGVDGSLRVERCTFSECETWADPGGAIYTIDCDVLLENSTFIDNEARQSSDGSGGAVGIVGSGVEDVLINHCTFYRNSASGTGGHLFMSGTFNTAALNNSILIAGSAAMGSPLLDVPAAVMQNSNYAGNTATDVMEITLNFDQGPLPVLPLVPGSLAIDNASGGEGAQTDARGKRRLGEGCAPDIGAYEWIANRYREWRALHFGAAESDDFSLALTLWGDEADPDEDGYSNIEEFLFAMDPTKPEAGLAPSLVFKNQGLFTYGGIAFRQNLDAAGSIGFRTERSTDLLNWTADLVPQQFVVVQPGYLENVHHSPQPMGLLGVGDREFFRIQAAGPVEELIFSPVREPGNPADSNGRGAVADSFRIARFETTNNSYVRFLNAVDPTGADPLDLYNPEMATQPASGIAYDAGEVDGQKYSAKSGFETLPVVYVDYWDAVRYANWMNNGASRLSDTETGAYTLLGGTPVPSNANAIAGRNSGARCFLPSVDEWYKAAYYQGGSSYSLYPNGTSSVNNDAPPGNSISANYSGTSVVTVGAYLSNANRHCVKDLGGNVDEFIEKSGVGDSVLNIGGRYSGGETLLRSSSWSSVSSTTTARYSVTGFRIATTID